MNHLNNSHPFASRGAGALDQSGALAAATLTGENFGEPEGLVL